MNDLLTPKEVANIFRVSARTVRNWVDNNVFPNVVRIGGTTRVPQSDIDALKSRVANG